MNAKPSTLQLTLRDPQSIRAHSHGEVTQAELFDKKKQPVVGGLFCPKIFGVPQEHACLCGKYAGQQNTSGVCEDCGVALLSQEELRQRFGHLELPTPLVHPWLFPVAAALVGLSTAALEELLAGQRYWVTRHLRPEKITNDFYVGALLDAAALHRAEKTFGAGALEVATGISALQDALDALDVVDLCAQLKSEIFHASSKATKEKLSARLALIKPLERSQQSASALLLEVLPVMPALYRAEEPASKKARIYEVEEAGEDEREAQPAEERHLNSLYQKVLRSSARLRKLQEQRASASAQHKEGAALQESVKELLAAIRANFLSNPLEKTTDFSGHAVVAANPLMGLSQCGVPVSMALILWRPYLLQRLRAEGLVSSYDDALDYLAHDPEVFDVLQEVMDERPVLLSRSPSLPTLSMLSLAPLLVQEEALQLHPLVASFLSLPLEGEHVSLQVMLSAEARREAQRALGVQENLLSGVTHALAWRLTREALVGLYYLTMAPLVDDASHAPAEPTPPPRLRPPQKVLPNLKHALYAYHQGALALREALEVRHQGQRFTTTAGRLLLAALAPGALPFDKINQPQTSASLRGLLRACLDDVGPHETERFLVALEALGARYATKAGLSLGVEDLVTPPNKEARLQEAQQLIWEVNDQYCEGLITDGERHNKLIEVWTQCRDTLHHEAQTQRKTAQSNLWLIAEATQEALSPRLSALYGLLNIASYNKDGYSALNEDPIRESLREGLGTVSFFYAAKASRREALSGRADEARDEALRAKLMPIIGGGCITEDDCGVDDGVAIPRISPKEGGLAPYITGRWLHRDFQAWRAPLYLTEELAASIDAAGAQELVVRSPLTCATKGGVCATCYGARGLKPRGVGFFAVQALEALKVSYEKATPSMQRIKAHRGGTIQLSEVRTLTNKEGELRVVSNYGSLKIVDAAQQVLEQQALPYGACLLVTEHAQVEPAQPLAEWDTTCFSSLTEQAGLVCYRDLIEGINCQETLDPLTGLSRRIVTESRLEHASPRLLLQDPKTYKELASYALPVGALLSAYDYSEVSVGEVLWRLPKRRAAQPQSASIAALLEAETPETPSVLASFDGKISYRQDYHANGKTYHRLALCADAGYETEYVILKGRHLFVHDGELVRAGDKLCDGDDNPHELMAVFGARHVAQHLLKELQRCALAAGKRLPNQHLELLLREMLRYVKVREVGDADLTEEQLVTRARFDAENARLAAAQQQAAFGEPALLGLSALLKQQEPGLAQLSQEPGHRSLMELALLGATLDLQQRDEAIFLGLAPPGAATR